MGCSKKYKYILYYFYYYIDIYVIYLINQIINKQKDNKEKLEEIQSYIYGLKVEQYILYNDNYN